MASKSKRRRRVFRASCILAALIIAGSSFAWFNSKDEVTNRLTASSDYGVSIVESFVPPATWLPGQAINKDVYAVNTGNVAAFVNEDVSAKLRYTYEQKSKTLKDTCVVLHDTEGEKVNGAVTYEAGGMLAWTDAKVSENVPTYKIGDIDVTSFTDLTSSPVTAYSDGTNGDPLTFNYSYTDTDTGITYYVQDLTTNNQKAYTVDASQYTDSSNTLTIGSKKQDTDATVDVGTINSMIVEGNGWTPTERGAYIFRRKIDNDINPGSETFTYAGYYFVPAGDTVNGITHDKDTYYKIIIGNDKYAETVADADGDGIADIVYDIDATQTQVQTLGATIDKDGIIKGKVDYSFVDVKDTGVQPQSLTLETGVDDGAGGTYDRLVAAYSLAAAGNGGYDASAVAARAEVDYKNAKKLSDVADQLYSYAEADIAYAKKLAEERNKLIAAADLTKDKKDALDAAETAKNQEKNDVFGSGEAYDAFKAAYALFAEDNTSGNNDLLDLDPTVAAPTGFVPQNVITAATTNADDNPLLAANYKALKDLWNNTTTPEVDSIQECITEIQAARTALNTLQSNSTDPDPVAVQTQIDEIKKYLAKLSSTNPDGLLQQYKKKYNDVVNSAEADANITIQTVVTDDQKTRIDEVINLCGDAIAAAANLDSEEAGYKDAYDVYQTALTNYNTQSGNFTQALEDYNTNVGSAKTTYDNALKDGDSTGTHYGQNHGKTIAAKGTDTTNNPGKTPGYSLTNRTATDNEDPTIDTSVSGYDNYENYLSTVVHKYDESEATIKDNLSMAYKYSKTKEQDNTNAPDEYVADTDATVSGKFADIAQFKNDKNDDRDNADQTRADAISALQGTSDIKVYINLDKDYATYWDYDEKKDGTELVSFYYKKILEPGVTSEKLIDSVELADSIKATDYKDLTFDLNVALDSAQVTYADDQHTYTAKAVQAPAFEMDVASITDNVDVAWKDKAPTAQKTKYTVDNGATEVTPVALNDGTGFTSDGTTYKWLIVDSSDGKTYVAESRANGTVFKEAKMNTDATTGAYTSINSIKTGEKTLKVERVNAE